MGLVFIVKRNMENINPQILTQLFNRVLDTLDEDAIKEIESIHNNGMTNVSPNFLSGRIVGAIQQEAKLFGFREVGDYSFQATPIQSALFSLFVKPEYKRVPHNKKSIEIVRLIWDIRENNVSWGKFRIAYQLFILGKVVSPSTVRNYLNQPKPPKKLLRKANKKKPDEPYTGKNKIKAKYTNHIWMADLTCVRILFIHVYVYFMMDVYSRKVFYGGISLFNPNTDWIIKRTKMQVNCLDFRDPPKHIITDNGSQFVSPEFKGFCKSYVIKHRTGKIGSPRTTAKMERFFETLKYESLNYIPFISKNELVDIIHNFINYYNNYRTHQSLFGFTPNMIYEGIKPDDLKTEGKIIKKRKFCKGLITAYYLDKAA